MAKKELKLKEPVKEVSGVKCHRCGNNDMQLEKDVKNEKVFVCLKCGTHLSVMPKLANK